jgi:hypothetical protein
MSPSSSFSEIHKLPIEPKGSSMTQLPPEYVMPYIGSNIFSILLSVVAALWPRISRWVFVVMSLAAGIINITTAIQQPWVYVDYGQSALPELYRLFIYGFFSQHTQPITQPIVLAIAAGQLIVGALLMRRGWLFGLGVLGGITFLVAIASIGVFSGFPATLIIAAALFVTGYKLLALYRHETEGR